MDWVLLVAYLQQKEVEDLSYVFCTDDYLLDLNQKFLHHNTLTDIITSRLFEGKE
jgi:ssRNA-specific RNase YbeY (16S rRNA maturation enzyme)